MLAGSFQETTYTRLNCVRFIFNESRTKHYFLEMPCDLLFGSKHIPQFHSFKYTDEILCLISHAVVRLTRKMIKLFLFCFPFFLFVTSRYLSAPLCATDSLKATSNSKQFWTGVYGRMVFLTG